MLRLKLWLSYTHRNCRPCSVKEDGLSPGLISRLCRQLYSLVLPEFLRRLPDRPVRNGGPTLTEVTPLHRHVSYEKYSSAIITDHYDNSTKHKRFEGSAGSFMFRAGGIYSNLCILEGHITLHL